MTPELKQRIRSRIVKVHGYNIRQDEKDELYREVHALVVETLLRIPALFLTFTYVNKVIDRKLDTLIGY